MKSKKILVFAVAACLLMSLLSVGFIGTLTASADTTAPTVVDVTTLSAAQKEGAHWILEFAPTDKGGYNEDSYRIKHAATGLYFAMDANYAFVMVPYEETNDKQVWQVGNHYGYYWNLMNKSLGKHLRIDGPNGTISYADSTDAAFGMATVENYEAGKINPTDAGHVVDNADRDALNGAEIVITPRFEGDWSLVKYQLYFPVPEDDNTDDDDNTVAATTPAAPTVVDVTTLSDAQKEGAHWILEFAPQDKGGYNSDSFRIKHAATGLYFAMTADNGFTMAAYAETDNKQVWQVGNHYGFYWNLFNIGAGKHLRISSAGLSYADSSDAAFGMATVADYEAGKLNPTDGVKLDSEAERDALNGTEIIIAQRFEGSFDWGEQKYQLWFPVPSVEIIDVSGLTAEQKVGTHWVLEFAPTDKGGYNHDSFRIKSPYLNMYLTATAEGNMIMAPYAANDQKQVWQVGNHYGYYWNLMNIGYGKHIRLSGAAGTISFADSSDAAVGMATVENFENGKLNATDAGQLKSEADRDALNGTEIIIAQRFESSFDWGEQKYQITCFVPAADDSTGDEGDDPEPPAPPVINYETTVPAANATANPNWSAADIQANGLTAYRFSVGAAADGEAIFEAGVAQHFRVMGVLGAAETSTSITYQVSNDGVTWTDVTATRTIEENTTSPNGGWPIFKDAGSATETFKYLKVIVKGTDYGWDPMIAQVEFDDQAPPAKEDFYDETVGATVPEKGAAFVDKALITDPTSYQWTLEADESGLGYRIKNVATGLYLTIDDAGDKNPRNDFLSTEEFDAESFTQVWKFVDHWGYKWKIQNVGTNRWLSLNKETLEISIVTSDPDDPHFTVLFAKDIDANMSPDNNLVITDMAVVKAGDVIVITPRIEMNWVEQNYPLYAAAPDTTGGDDNTGDDNTGDDNTGDDNTGDDNTGDDNTGDDTTNPDTGVSNSLLYAIVLLTAAGSALVFTRKRART